MRHVDLFSLMRILTRFALICFRGFQICIYVQKKKEKKKSKITEAEAGIDQSIQSLLPQPYCKSNHAK